MIVKTSVAAKGVPPAVISIQICELTKVVPTVKVPIAPDPDPTTSKEVAEEYRPSKTLIVWNWIAFVAMTLFALGFFYLTKESPEAKKPELTP